MSIGEPEVTVGAGTVIMTEHEKMMADEINRQKRQPTLRDQFAMRLAPALIAIKLADNEIAKAAYEIADSMIKEREKE